MNNDIAIADVVPFSTVDYPERLSAVIFCQGCTLKCCYCYNSHLCSIKTPCKISWNEVTSFLTSRINLLDGVVFSGGEPLIHKSLCEAIIEVKKMGFNVGLHTAGVFSKRLFRILPNLDWIGLDVKCFWKDYPLITKVDVGQQVKESLQLILNSNVNYEIRTTLDDFLLKSNYIVKLAEYLSSLGVKYYTIQKQRNRNNDIIINEEFMKKLFIRFTIR